MTTNQYIDYREKLRDLYISQNGSNPGKQITEGLDFYDWNIKLESEYRKSVNLPEKTLITDKAVYEYALSKK